MIFHLRQPIAQNETLESVFRSIHRSLSNIFFCSNAAAPEREPNQVKSCTVAVKNNAVWNPLAYFIPKFWIRNCTSFFFYEVSRFVCVQSLAICQNVTSYCFLAPMSINKTRNPTPRWLQAACGKLLSDRLVQKDGVMNVLRGVLDLGGDSDPQKYQIIAHAISHPPSTGSYSDLVIFMTLGV